MRSRAPRDRGVGMPECMDRSVFGETALAYHEFKGLLEGSRRQGHLLVPSREPPGPGACALPVRSQPFQAPCGQGHQAVFAPLALADPDQHTLGVDVRDLEMGSFPEAQSTGVDHLQTQSCFRVDYRAQQQADFLQTQHDGQFLAVPRPSEREDRPRSLQGHLIEKPDAIEVDAEGTLGDLLVIEEIEKILPELIFAELIRSTPVVLGQMFDGIEIALLGPGGQAPELQVFPHTASERSHRHPPIRGEHYGSTRSTRIRKIEGRSA
jgi:hypothetical protein